MASTDYQKAYDDAHYQLFASAHEHPDAKAVDNICKALVQLSNIGSEKVFFLDRKQDPSGISGTGRIADGIVFTDGKVVLHWLSSKSIAIYDSLAVVEKIHGHGGQTEIIWLEGLHRDPPAPKAVG